MKVKLRPKSFVYKLIFKNLKRTMISVCLRSRNTWNEKYSKRNNCVKSVDICDLEWKIFEESANIWDLAVTCHFYYVIDHF